MKTCKSVKGIHKCEKVDVYGFFNNLTRFLSLQIEVILLHTLFSLYPVKNMYSIISYVCCAEQTVIR